MDYIERVKQLITDNDVKQKKLAAEVGITEGMFSKYMTRRSNIPVDVLIKIANRFDVSLDYIVGLTDEPKIPLSLSGPERDLTQRFRTLNKSQKELILQNICFMQEQNQR